MGGSFLDIAYRLALIIQIKISTLPCGDFGAISVTERADRTSGTSHIGQVLCYTLVQYEQVLIRTVAEVNK